MKVAFSLAICAKIFSLDIFPVMTADSGHYVGEATSGKYVENPLAVVMPRHYKTAGYPLYIAFWNGLSTLVALDGITLTVLSQRVLLAIAVTWLIFALGLASVPLALFFSSDELLAQSNFVLTEGVTVPVGILFALAALRLYQRRNEPLLLKTTVFWLFFALLALSYLLLVFTKLPLLFSAVTLVPLIADIRVRERAVRMEATRAAVPVLCICALAIVYCAVLTAGNYRGFGALTPAVGKERIFYWSLWETAFRDSLHNRTRSGLAQFYDNGSPYRFIQEVEARCGGLAEFGCTAAPFRRRAQELIQTAGISLPKERLRSFFLGLLGGGKFELTRKRAKIMALNGKDTAIGQSLGALCRRFGQVLPKERSPRMVKGLWRGERKPGPVAGVQVAITVALLAGVVFLAARRKIELGDLCVWSLINHVILCMGFAWILCDVWRYILPGWSAFATVQAACMADIARNELFPRRGRNEPRAHSAIDGGGHG